MMTVTTDKKINAALWLTYSAYLLLLVVLTLDTLAASEPSWVIWSLQVLPLLLILPGIIYKHYRSYSWLCFLMLAYFTSHVVQVYSSTRDPHDWFGLAATIIVFIAAMFASRWLQRLQKSAINT